MTSDPFANLFSLNPYQLGILVAVVCICTTCLYIWSSPKTAANARGPPLDEHAHPAACRKIGAEASNLEDEHDPQYNGAAQKELGNAWRVKSALIYPVKSCKGIELDTCKVTGLGMEYDRQFAFAQYRKRQRTDDVGWKFITQRQIHAMANVEIEVWVPDPPSPQYALDHPNVQSQGVIGIRWPSHDSGKESHVPTPMSKTVYFPFNPTTSQQKRLGYSTVDMEIWKDTPPALMIASTTSSAPAAAWTHDLLHYLSTTHKVQNPSSRFDLTRPFALLRTAPSSPRHVFRNAPKKETLGYQPIVGFQDAYPVQILGLASVRDIGSKLKQSVPPLSAKNFRPNIVVVGGDAYEEDRWKYIRIVGESRSVKEKVGNKRGTDFHVACRTGRCLMPNVDQSTGIKHAKEPNDTLKATRKIEPHCKDDVFLGMHMVPAVQEEQTISVGDTVEVLEEGEHYYIKGK